MPLNPLQASLRGLTIGQGTDYPGIGGVHGIYLAPTPTAADVAIAGGHGVRGAFDRMETRPIIVPVLIAADVAATAENRLDTLKAAWAPTGVDVELAVRLEGDERRYFGRPRGVDDQAVSGRMLTQGVLEVECTFVATDPLAYDPGVAVAAGTSIVCTNLGNMTSHRGTLTVVGNGGTPVITNTTTGGTITFTTAVTGAETAEIDLYEQTVLIGGAHAENRTSPASSWFGWQAGANTVTVTGAASVAATVRSAWL